MEEALIFWLYVYNHLPLSMQYTEENSLYYNDVCMSDSSDTSAVH